MANIKDFIKKIGNSAVSLEEQQQALAQVEQTIIEAKQKRTEAVGKNADMVIQALKTIEAKLEAKLNELNNTPAKQGVQGPAGQDGKNGKDGKAGRDGISGKDGTDGKDGVDGKDGISVVDAKIDFDGSLVVYLSNGSEIDCGQILQPEVAKNIIISSGGSGTSQVVTDTLVSLQNQINTLTGIDGVLGDMAQQNANAVAITGGTATLASLDIITSGTDAEIAPNTGITGWNYSGTSFSITAQETAPTGLFFSPDGLNMYVCGSTGDDVNQYTLSTAWDVSTATFLGLFSVAAQDTTPSDIFFKPDGLAMFVLGDTNNGVFQYTLSSAFDISTASYASKAFSVTSQETTPVGLWFKSDGTVMYVIGTAQDTVFQYNLGTAWDVSTASYASISFSVQTQEGTPNQVNLSADGLTMWILGATGDDISQYALGTAWNVSTAVFENSFYIGFQDNNPQGLFIDSTADNRVYIVGTTSDSVYQYNTVTNSISAVTDVFNTTSNARVQGNLAVQSNAYIDGALTVQGNITTASTGSFNGLSSSGTTTIATSTATQTSTFGAGATVSGSTKTLNIGTAGVSGSTTAINIGSAVSGATSTTTLNGLVIDSISAAVSAAGTAQGTATALVSNINNVTVVATGATGVRLPTAVAGMRILIRNSDSADTLNIYPATGGTINALAANAAFTLTAGSTTELMATTATQWYTF